MRAYTCNFGGHYINGNAVVIARGRKRAYDMMVVKLFEIGLGQTNFARDDDNNFTEDDLHPLPIKCTGKEYIRILFDGNY